MVQLDEEHTPKSMMAHGRRASPALWCSSVLLLLLVLLVAATEAVSPSTNKRRSSSARSSTPKGNIADREYNRKRNLCASGSHHAGHLADCAQQQIDVENCILKCVSALRPGGRSPLALLCLLQRGGQEPRVRLPG